MNLKFLSITDFIITALIGLLSILIFILIPVDTYEFLTNPEDSLGSISKDINNEMPQGRSLVSDMLYDYNLSLQDALSSEHFQLFIVRLSKDSLILAAPNGYGKIFLGRKC